MSKIITLPFSLLRFMPCYSTKAFRAEEFVEQHCNVQSLYQAAARTAFNSRTCEHCTELPRDFSSVRGGFKSLTKSLRRLFAPEVHAMLLDKGFTSRGASDAEHCNAQSLSRTAAYAAFKSRTCEHCTGLRTSKCVVHKLRYGTSLRV